MDRRDIGLLYKSFDVPLKDDEAKRLEDALRKSPRLREEKERLSRMRSMVGDSAIRSFGPHFPERVMGRIRETTAQNRNGEQFFEFLISSFRPLAIGAAAAAFLLISFNILRSDRITVAAAFAEPRITVEEANDPTLMFYGESVP